MTIPAAELSRAARRIVLRARRALFGPTGTSAQGAIRGRGLSFEEVRPYLPGDDIRAIDWKVTARMGHPFVKSFAEEREQTIWLLVEESTRLRWGSAGTTKQELATDTAALIALAASLQGDRVGLMTFGESSIRVQPKRSHRQALAVVRRLLEKRSPAPPTSLAEAVTALRRLAKSRSLIFVITDGLTPGGADDLRPLCRHHELHFMQISDPWELELPVMGLVRFADCGTGETRLVDTSDAGFRKAYRHQASQRMRSLGHSLARLEIPLISVRTDRPAAISLQSHFRR